MFIWWMCETELRLSNSILPASLMWPRDGCLNQRSFCFYAEMWALSSAGLCCLCFDPPLSFLDFLSISVPLASLSLCLIPPPSLLCSFLLSCFFFFSLLVTLIHAYFIYFPQAVSENIHSLSTFYLKLLKKITFFPIYFLSYFTLFPLNTAIQIIYFCARTHGFVCCHFNKLHSQK